VRKLYLGKDSIDDEGVSLIAESLKGPCQLSELRLHDNKIGTNSEKSALDEVERLHLVNIPWH
jgi:hypothetical protein